MNGRPMDHFLAMVVAIISALAVGDSMPLQAAGQSGPRRDGHAQSPPRSPRMKKSTENDMQRRNADSTERVTGTDVEPTPIDSGFVILEGRYVPPPYAVRSDSNSVYVNGLKIPQRRPGPFFRGPPGMYLPNRRPQNRGASQLEQHFREDGLLICTQDRLIARVSAHQAVSILEVLVSDESADVKTEKLVQTNTPWVTSDQWASVVESFEAPADLSERVRALRQRLEGHGEDETDYEQHWSVLSGLTLSGFILAVWALGTLMTCRPPLRSQHSQALVLPQERQHQVIWLVVLLVALNVHDLACTLFAGGAGGLWELNPFAGSIIRQSSLIIVFKMGLTLGASILFVVTRQYKLTQIGSWWAAVLYTVLILRWTIFNSMFL